MNKTLRLVLWIAIVASAVNNAVSWIAGLIAIAIIGAGTGSHLDTAGFHRALIMTAVLLASGGVILAVGIHNGPKVTEALIKEGS